jgi:hypothetical protein
MAEEREGNEKDTQDIRVRSDPSYDHAVIFTGQEKEPGEKGDKRFLR